MSRPFHSARPSVGRVIVARIRMRVDFPAPFGPSRPSTPASSSRVKFLSPQKSSLYRFPTPSMVSFMDCLLAALYAGGGGKLPVLFMHRLMRRPRAAVAGPAHADLLQDLRQLLAAPHAEVERANGERDGDPVLIEGALQELDGLAAGLEIVGLLRGEVDPEPPHEDDRAVAELLEEDLDLGIRLASRDLLEGPRRHLPDLLQVV